MCGERLQTCMSSDMCLRSGVIDGSLRDEARDRPPLHRPAIEAVRRWESERMPTETETARPAMPFQSKNQIVWFRSYGAGDAELTRLQRFFVRNYYPHRIEELADFPLGVNGDSDLPAVVMPDGRVLVRPTITALADELGITELPDPQTTYDVTVVGAGPSGLAAAV